MTELAEQLSEDEALIREIAGGRHEDECERQPDTPCFCQVRVAQAAVRLLSVKSAWRGQTGDDVGYDCDGRAMVTFRADGGVEVYIPKAAPPSSTEGSKDR